MRGQMVPIPIVDINFLCALELQGLAVHIAIQIVIVCISFCIYACSRIVVLVTIIMQLMFYVVSWLQFLYKCHMYSRVSRISS